MFGISGEHLLILGIILLFFGPRRLPELGNTLGKAIRNFKDAISGVEEATYRKLPEEAARASQGPQAQPAAAQSPGPTPVQAETVAAAPQPSHQNDPNKS